MIGKLKGIIDTLGDDWVILDVQGVGYFVYCSAHTLRALSPHHGAELFIETHVREDHIHLFGFATEEEKYAFLKLTSVQGVGNKMGLAILSVVSPAQAFQAIAAGDQTVFTQVSGVGPKLGSRIVSELKNKVGSFSALTSSLPQGSTETPPLFEDAVSALVHLGYKRVEAFEAVGKALKELGHAASSADLIRRALTFFAS